MSTEELLAWLTEQGGSARAAWQSARDGVMAIGARIGYLDVGSPSDRGSNGIVRTPSVIVGPQAPVVVGPQTCVAVTPPPRPAWDDHGWRVRPHPRGRIYEGEYRVRTPHMREPQRFAGRIVQPMWPGTIA